MKPSLAEVVAWAKGNERLKKSSTARRAGGALIRGLLRTGLVTWGTKSFECWSALVAALAIVRPTSILELGSGRSTSYLGDYAAKSGVLLASLEQNWFYAHKVRRGLRRGFLDPSCVHYAPLDADGWYSERALDVVAARPFDMVFVDGPVGAEEGMGSGQRANARAVEWLAHAVRQARLLVVDDVHRSSCFGLLQELLSRREKRDASLGLTPIYLTYLAEEGPNVLAIAAEETASRDLAEICRLEGIDFARENVPAVSFR
jgi:predicted O-methyltransferase YrrM